MSHIFPTGDWFGAVEDAFLTLAPFAGNGKRSRREKTSYGLFLLFDDNLLIVFIMGKVFFRMIEV